MIRDDDVRRSKILAEAIRRRADVKARELVAGFGERLDYRAKEGVKGGRDPAGALERLGAALKSFEATPAWCKNILVAGVITTEMASRLEERAVRFYELDDLLTEEGWMVFANELFHHILRIA